MDSPAVQISEYNAPHYRPTLTNEVAAFVGTFERGPIDYPIYITSVDEFKFLFGRGIGEFTNDWYQVYNYLQYASGIYVVRSTGVHSGNANNGAEILVNRYSEWKDMKSTIAVDGIRFIAKTPGSWGNILSVSVITKTDWNNNVVIKGTLKAQEVFSYFEEKHLGVAVFRDTELVETFYKSYFNINDIDDESLYVYVKIEDTLANYKELENISDFNVYDGVLDCGGILTTDSYESLGDLNTYSQEVIDLGTTLQTFEEYISSKFSYYNSSIISFTNGYSTPPTDEDLATSYAILENKEEYDIDIIIGNDKANNLAVNLAESRKDCIAFIGLPPFLMTILKLRMGVDNPDEVALTQKGDIIISSAHRISPKISDADFVRLNAYVDSIPFSEYVHFTFDIKLQTDLFTGKTTLVNVAGDTAGLKSQASLVAPWAVGAGLERGRIKNAKKMYINLSDSRMNTYYKKGLNLVKDNVLMSQKTFYTKPSSYNRIHTRSLFNHIEKEAQRILQSFTFEESTLSERKIMASRMKRYLEDVQLHKGIYGAQVQVYPDDSNNPIIEIAVRPTYLSELIKLRITNAGTTDITELVK